MQDFRNLEVWKRAHELTVQLYQVTAGVSDRKYPGLIAQMRRAAASVPAHIAEGCGYTSQAEFARSLQHAIAAVTELEYHLILAHDLHLIPPTAYARLDARTIQTRQMLHGLIRKVREQRRPLTPRSQRPPLGS